MIALLEHLINELALFKEQMNHNIKIMKIQKLVMKS